MPTITLGRERKINFLFWAFSIKYLSICSVTSKSEITPALKGRVATMWPGVLPTIFLASSPIAKI